MILQQGVNELDERCKESLDVVLNGKVGVGVAKADDVVNAFKKAKTEIRCFQEFFLSFPVLSRKFEVLLNFLNL
jgi:hypothetical protein